MSFVTGYTGNNVRVQCPANTYVFIGKIQSLYAKKFESVHKQIDKQLSYENSNARKNWKLIRKVIEGTIRDLNDPWKSFFIGFTAERRKDKIEVGIVAGGGGGGGGQGPKKAGVKNLKLIF